MMKKYVPVSTSKKTIANLLEDFVHAWTNPEKGICMQEQLQFNFGRQQRF